MENKRTSGSLYRDIKREFLTGRRGERKENRK